MRMKSRKLSPSEKVVSSVSSFVAGRKLYGKPLPSAFELELDLLRLKRRAKEFEDGKPRPGPLASLFNEAWDTFMAFLVAMFYASLRIALFFTIWGVIILVVI